MFYLKRNFRVGCQNLLQLKGFITNGVDEKNIILITEHCIPILQYYEHLSNKDVLSCMEQIISALRFLISNDIDVHSITVNNLFVCKFEKIWFLTIEADNKNASKKKKKGFSIFTFSHQK